jgi:hypothetical protein
LSYWRLIGPKMPSIAFPHAVIAHFWEGGSLRRRSLTPHAFNSGPSAFLSISAIPLSPKCRTLGLQNTAPESGHPFSAIFSVRSPLMQKSGWIILFTVGKGLVWDDGIKIAIWHSFPGNADHSETRDV